MTVRGHVTNGRLVVDVPTDLPEGTEVELVSAIDRCSRSMEAGRTGHARGGPRSCAWRRTFMQVHDRTHPYGGPQSFMGRTAFIHIHDPVPS